MSNGSMSDSDRIARHTVGRRVPGMARLSLAVALALAAPGMALAQTAKERELQARVAQLEKMVEQPVAQQQQTQTQVADVQAQVSEVKTAQAQMSKPAPEGKQPVQGTTIMATANPGTTFSYGGFIKMDAMATDISDGRIADDSAGRLTKRAHSLHANLIYSPFPSWTWARN